MKVHQPETLSQARAHGTYTARYVDLGLCRACAAQAAYGHQLGFRQVEPPCSTCAPVVAAFPVKAGGEVWRKATSADLLPVAPLPGVKTLASRAARTAEPVTAGEEVCAA